MSGPKLDKTRSFRSENKSYYPTSSISDVEKDGSDKYKKLAKKLSKDKEKLKEKVRVLLDEVDSKSLEIEKTKDYYQEQITDLLEERDQAQTEVQKMKTYFLEEKDNLKDQYESKINLQKENLSKRFSSREIETKQMINNLEEKVTSLYQSIKDKDIQIETINNTNESFLKHFKDDTERKIKNCEKKREDETLSLKLEIEKLKIDKDREYKSLSENTKRDFEELKNKYENKISILNTEFNIEKEKNQNSHLKELDNLTHQLTKKYDLSLFSLKKDIDEYKKEISNFNHEINILKDRHKHSLEENTRQFENKYREYQIRNESQEKEINSLKLSLQKARGENEETIHRLKEQNNYLKENIKKLQDNYQYTNNQYVSNLQKQKEIFDKEISNRDSTINIMEKKLRSMKDEANEKITILDKRCQSLFEDLKNITEKYNSVKNDKEKYESQYNSIKIENSKLKEISDKAIEQARNKEFEKETSVKRLQIDLDQKITELDNIQKNYKDIHSKLNDIYTKYNSSENRIKDVEAELDRKERNIKEYKKDIDAYIQKEKVLRDEIVSNKKSFIDEKKNFQIELQGEKDRIVSDLNKKISSLEHELKLASQAKYMSDENIIKLTTERDSYKKNYEYKENKEKSLQEALRKIETLEHMLSMSDKTKKGLEQNLDLLSEKFKKTVENTTSDYNNKCKEIEKLKEQLDRNNLSLTEKISELNNTLINKEKEIARKDTEILLLKPKIEEVQKLQEEMIKNNANFSNQLNTYKSEISKLKNSQISKVF